MGDIIQVNDGAQLFRVSVLLRRGGIGRKHDIAGLAAHGLGKHQSVSEEQSQPLPYSLRILITKGLGQAFTA